MSSPAFLSRVCYEVQGSLWGGGRVLQQESARPVTTEVATLRVEVWESVSADCLITKPIEMTGSAAEDVETTLLVAQSVMWDWVRTPLTHAMRSDTHWHETLSQLRSVRKFIPTKVKSWEVMRSDLFALRRSPQERSSFQANSRFQRSS